MGDASCAVLVNKRARIKSIKLKGRIQWMWFVVRNGVRKNPA